MSFVRPENHTWRIVTPGHVWYLKAHTKSWYGNDARDAGRTVQHEMTGHRILAEAGLPTPTVDAFSTTRDNPLGWPYLLTTALPGSSLVELLPTSSRGEADAALRQVGRHLAAMHTLTFEYPGYLLDGAPTREPAVDAYQHPSWRYERFLKDAICTWADDSTKVRPAVTDQLTRLLADSIDDLRDAYEPPRFVHGDCHANGFFLEDGAVTGVLDLEVTSAGCPLFDLTKLAIELTGRLHGSRYNWWKPLYDGYGAEPDFNLIRLLLAGSNHHNYTCLGDHAWPGDRSAILTRILTATTWQQLFSST
ncbi:hypothetical protein GCM10009804_41420 [Kribbella hippodromi]|uniref:Aminoglycoside phosphotransferase domain-containing protein n=1 Tax=Kribbella hippodromi TaxID=434347 RepID=A0ABP4PNE5_9ACTN